MSAKWIDLGFEVGGVYANPYSFTKYVWRSDEKSFWTLDSFASSNSQKCPIDPLGKTFSDGWSKCFHRFDSPKQVRAFLYEKVPALGRFSVRSVLAIVGKLEQSTIDDIQLIFIVTANQATKEERGLVMDSLKKSNAFLKAVKVPKS